MASGSEYEPPRVQLPSVNWLPRPWVNSFTVCVALAVAYVFGQAIHSLTLHSLAGVPGPKLCAVSRLPYWYHYFRGRDVHWIHQLHLRYGPELRFGPTDISYTAAPAWKDVCGFPKGQAENSKAPEFSVEPVNGVPSMLSANFEDHSRVRRLFSPAFSERALRNQEPLFQQYASLLIEKLHGLGVNGQSVEMTRPLNFATFDVMAELCFGHPLGLLEKNDFSPWVHSVFASVRMLPIVSMIRYYPLLTTLFEYLEPRSVTEQRKVHCQHAADRVDERLREGATGKPDVWRFVEDAGDEKLSLEEMHSNAEIFMLAGSETGATTLSAALFYLLAYPSTMERLAAEVRGTFNRREDITFERLTRLPYLNACLKEVLRVFPPVPIGSPRIIPTGGRHILGRWVPPDTHVSVHHYATSHSPANFSDAENFVPSRWLPEGIEGRYSDDVREAASPFGWGTRNCLGQIMAMHEMRLILACLVFAFDFELCDESREWADARAFALWEKNNLMCRLKPTGN